MKVLQVITSLLNGGAETIVVNLTTQLRRMGHVVDVCVFNEEETPLMERLRKENPEVKIYKLGRGYYDLRYIPRLAKIMKDYDVVHAHNSSPQLFVALASLRCPKVRLVTTEHNTTNRKRQMAWMKPVERWMYRRYDHTVCISDIAEKLLREYLGGAWMDSKSAIYNKVSTIANGVDVNAIHEAEADGELLKQKGGRCAIVMVARFRAQKDQDTLMRALARLDKDAFEVWFAGEGERLEEVQQLAKGMSVADNVQFLGLRTDVPQVLHAADIVVMSSHWEGLSLSNIEGMSAGKPFIASDVNGLREVTKGYGTLFPEGDDKALAEIIQRLHDDTDYYQQVAGRCWQRAQEFDITKMLAAYNKVYQSL